MKAAGRAVCIAAILCGVDMAAAASRVPLPKPRPVDAPQVAPAPAPAKETNAKPADDRRPADEAAAVRSALRPSACRLALTDAIAIAPTIPPISGPGACGGDDLVRLEAVVLPGGSRVPLKPAATLRCRMAAAVADWVRGDVAAIASEAGTTISELDNFDSFSCRGRNRVAGAKLSEHGRANALDLRGVKLADGRFVSFTDRAVARELREKVLLSVCARFSTVLGPGSDGYHEDHVHLDLAERRSGYRICQWEVWDQMPRIAPLLPAVRPDEAPARETAEEKAKREAEDEKARALQSAPAATPAASDAETKPRARPGRRTRAEGPSDRHPASRMPAANKKGAGSSSAFR